LKGEDMIAQAKTGTGKTAAFLLPSIEKLLVLKDQGLAGKGSNNPGIAVVIISPTRELANQIAKEAGTLCRFHHAFTVVTLVGGMPLPIDRQRIEGGVDILVATPGRMADHLKNT
jgi:superfamily II DNA/RNA helicase